MLAGCSQPPVLDSNESRIVADARSVAADVEIKRLKKDGGLLINGTLEGRQFALAIPSNWNRQVVLFAHGYRIPGASIHVRENPIKDDDFGVLRTPYSQGFAVGHSAYDKSGMGVQSGVLNTYRLKRFVEDLGATRVYLTGGSMGANIVIALIEKYPQDFAGALAACGVTGDWHAEVGHLVDLRAAYNYFTRGTEYELPGEKDLSRSALSTPSPGLPKPVASALRFLKVKRVADPVLALFAAAEADPGSPEARIIDNIAAVTGAEKDLAAFGIPLVMVALGMDDLNATFGGTLYDNANKQYLSTHLTAQENDALNAAIQRTPSAQPAAVAKAAQWHTTTGQFQVPLLSIFNEIDPLVPSELHEPQLLTVAEQAGSVEYLLQRSLPAQREKLPGTDAEGYVHCGFTKEQVAKAWNDLRGWVETGIKPTDIATTQNER